MVVRPGEGAPEMFGIGYQEMFVILVVAMVIFGPARLPELAGQVGRWVRDFRRMSSDLTGEFEKTFAEVDEVKRTIKREIDSIQDEVEGVQRSASGDLKKSAAKAGPKKLGAGAAKAGAGSGASSSSAARPAASSAKAAPAKAAATGARETASATKRGKSNGKANGKAAGAPLALPVATKADPLADVSFFDLDVELVASENGAASGNGTAAEPGDEALARVRQRRAAASYGRRYPA
jgi:sec-independent protein translocase protein TatB